MNRQDRQKQTIERKKQQERIKKVREKRWGKTDSQMQEFILMQAKMILGLVIFPN